MSHSLTHDVAVYSPWTVKYGPDEKRSHVWGISSGIFLFSRQRQNFYRKFEHQVSTKRKKDDIFSFNFMNESISAWCEIEPFASLHLFKLISFYENINIQPKNMMPQ